MFSSQIDWGYLRPRDMFSSQIDSWVRGNLSPKATVWGSKEEVKDEFSLGPVESEWLEAQGSVPAKDLGCSSTEMKNVLTPKFPRWDKRSVFMYVSHSLLWASVWLPNIHLPTTRWLSGLLSGKPSRDGTSWVSRNVGVGRFHTSRQHSFLQAWWNTSSLHKGPFQFVILIKIPVNRFNFYFLNFITFLVNSFVI